MQSNQNVSLLKGLLKEGYKPATAAQAPTRASFPAPTRASFPSVDGTGGPTGGFASTGGTVAEANSAKSEIWLGDLDSNQD
jgi:hypothetical protein